MFSPRISVSLLFFMNGFLIGNWAPQIPEFINRHSLDESQMGLMIAIFGAGSLLLMPLTGISIARYGVVKITKLTSALAAATLFWIIFAPDILTATLAIFIFGGFIAAMDVAMNAFAVDVERQLSKPVMSSCHGFWSLGGLAGAISGGYIIQSFSNASQALITVIIATILVAFAWAKIISKDVAHKSTRQPIQFPRTLLPWLIGIVALFAAMPEGAIIDWSALYLRQEFGATALTSSLAFGAFSAAMAIVRFAGDPIRANLGAVKTVKICALTAAVGLLLSGLATSPLLVIIGFAIAGLGLSNIVPIAFAAAGNLPGLAPGIGLSLTTTIGYSGVLVAPAILGYIAEYTGFALLFSSLAAFLLAVYFMAPKTHYADFDQEQS